ncbi:MAG: hypothetical protein ACD_75C02367G0003 [uncultured bacterium]|nr:MAG: hypothetical protein ACD_75C02367G0003 [uncultured bacterium]
MARDMPVMVLPSSMPSKGIAYCGVYQGSTRMMTRRASAVTEKEETNMAPRLRVKPEIPAILRCCRAQTSRPAASSMTVAMSRTKSRLPLAKR